MRIPKQPCDRASFLDNAEAVQITCKPGNFDDAVCAGRKPSPAVIECQESAIAQSISEFKRGSTINHKVIRGQSLLNGSFSQVAHIAQFLDLSGCNCSWPIDCIDTDREIFDAIKVSQQRIRIGLVLERIYTQPTRQNIATPAAANQVITCARIDDVIARTREDGVIFACTRDGEPFDAREGDKVQDSSVCAADVAQGGAIEATAIEPHPRAGIADGIVHNQVIQSSAPKNSVGTQPSINGVVACPRLDVVVGSEDRTIDNASLEDSVVATACDQAKPLKIGRPDHSRDIDV